MSSQSNRHVPQPIVAQRAAVQAAVHRHYQAPRRPFVVPSRPVTATVLVRRVVSPDELETIARGLEATETYSIKLAIISDDIAEGEVIRSDGTVLYFGTTRSRVESLLEMFVAIESHMPCSAVVEIPLEPTDEMRRTSLGFVAAEAYSIRFAVVGEVLQGELIGSAGRVLFSGMGDSRSDGLQEMLMSLIEDEDSST